MFPGERAHRHRLLLGQITPPLEQAYGPAACSLLFPSFFKAVFGNQPIILPFWGLPSATVCIESGLILQMEDTKSILQGL